MKSPRDPEDPEKPRESEVPGRARARAMTLVEMLVAVTIFGGVLFTIVSLYQHSVRSFRITAWKQDRTRQVQLFWEKLRKPLEEATEDLEVDVSPPYKIQRSFRPLKFRPGRSSADGNLLAWQIDRVDINPPAPPTVAGPITLVVEKKSRAVYLNLPGSRPVVVEDIEFVEIKVTNICQDPTTFAEFLEDPAAPSGAEVVGGIIECGFLCRPQPQQKLPDVRLPLNAKFKVPVPCVEDPSPNY